MFKARWKSDRSKIKALFKLRLEVVQVPQPGWESLVVSLVSLDAGKKASARSERAAVVAGTCTWEKAVFQAVKLARDPKTGKIVEKAYRFLVSGNESAKDRVLGEATLDFADYAESIKPSAVSLQLKGVLGSSAVLHITVQRVQHNANGIENEEEETRTTNGRLSNGDAAEAYQSSNGNSTAEEGSPLNGQAELRFHSMRTMGMHLGPTENIGKSRSFDASSGVCRGSGGPGRNTPTDALSRNMKFLKSPHNFLSPLRNSDSPQKKTSDSSDVVATNGDRWGLHTEWSLSSVPDESLDGSTHSSEDTGLRDRLQEDNTDEKLKNDAVSLARQVEVAELELQALRKQVVKDRRQGEDLLKEVQLLREERDSLKNKCESLSASSYDVGKEKSSSLQDEKDLRSMLEETRHELHHERSLNATLSLQLQKMQDSNSELIFAVKDLEEELLEQKSRETICPRCQWDPAEKPVQSFDNGLASVWHSNGLSCEKEDKANGAVGTNSEHEEDEELQVLAKERNDSASALSLEQKINELNADVELYKKEHDDIEMQMEQLALDYEILKQEHHDISTKYEQSQLREQLRMQYECSAHISIINDLEAQVGQLEKELERQEGMFEEDLASITKLKIEQEQRAIRAEAALQKSKWNNVTAAERLQNEFKLLSSQMSVTFVANEKLTLKAIAEANELRLQKIHLEESLAKAREESKSVKDQFRLQLKELLDQVNLKTSEVDVLHSKLKIKCEELENQRKIQLSTEKSLSVETSFLKSEIEKLETDKLELSKQITGELKLMGDIECLKIMDEEKEKLLQDRIKERDALFEQLNCAQDELEKSREELENIEKSIKEKESNIRSLRCDLESLRAQYNGLKKSFLEGEMEKENLRKKLRHFKQSGSYSSVKEDNNADIGEERNGMVDRLNVVSTKESIEDAIAGKTTVEYQKELLSEMEELKGKNQSMEEELKEMQGRYSELSLKFAEVEGERQQLVMRVRSLKNMVRS